MARDFVSVSTQLVKGIAREHARQQRHTAKFARERAQAQKQEYLASRVADADDANAELDHAIDQLQSLLKDALARSTAINWISLLEVVDESVLDNDSSLTLPDSQPDEATYLPKMPSRIARLLPGWETRYGVKLTNAKRRFASDAAQYAQIEQRRLEALMALKFSVEKQNREVTTFRDAYRAGRPNAVVGYFEAIFDRSSYPDGFPRCRRIFFSPDSHQLIVDFQAPNIDDIIPSVERYKFVKTSNQVVEVKRSVKERHALYSSVIAQLALRQLHEAFRGDREEIVQVVVLNAFIDTIDPATGQRVKPYVVSLRTTREQFEQLDLSNVEPHACLKRLSASVSRSPAELLAVKPIVDINMVDPRFVKETDVLSSLDQRPNLMELTPSEFESLTTNLFEKMGLEAKQTQASRDGGVDCVAFDPRPILGGKVVVQAKRYKNTVGVSAVRDLFGTMMNEGASKGILLTTSGYGKAAYEFANGKPIELLDGSNLLYLLKEHAGVDAKIVVPDDWIDPRLNG
jgi:restriction system protein